MTEHSDAALPSGPGGHQSEDWPASAPSGQHRPEDRLLSSSSDPYQAGQRPPDGHRPENSFAGVLSGRLPLSAALVLVIAGTALLGVAAGYIWSAVAPRAVIVVIGRGAADVVNPETRAFITADAWFALVSVAGGVISGLAGYVLAVRRHGAIAMAGILAGAVAAALIARWIGQESGRAAVSHSLAIGHPGTLLREPLSLGGTGVLAFWPLAAGLVAGGIEAIALLRERRQRQTAPSGLSFPGPIPPGPSRPWPPDQPQPGQLRPPEQPG
jgi:hypothetical protein